MEVTLTLHTPEIAIGENAKICYNTKPMSEGGKDITKSLVHGHGHLAALRFAYATFNIKGVSIACQNQMVRSKHLDHMVQSKRYVDIDKGDVSFVMPKNLTEEQEELMLQNYISATDTYRKLVASGVKKEDARAVLPVNTSTNLNVTGNLQAFNDFFKLRLTKHAQSEIRELANIMYDKLAEVYPKVFTPEHKIKLSEGLK